MAVRDALRVMVVLLHSGGRAVPRGQVSLSGFGDSREKPGLSPDRAVYLQLGTLKKRGRREALCPLCGVLLCRSF